MQARAVRGIDRAFEDLRPVARQQCFRDAHAGVGGRRPGRRHEFGDGVLRTHISPHHAAPFLHGIGLVLDLVGHATRCRLGHHFKHIACDVKLPAVIQAAQAGVFVAAVDQRRTTVRTILVEHANVAFRVPEYDQVFAEHARFDRRAVRLADLFDEANRRPVSAHQLAHRGIAFDAAQQFVFLVGQHVMSPGERSPYQQVSLNYIRDLVKLARTFLRHPGKYVGREFG